LETSVAVAKRFESKLHVLRVREAMPEAYARVARPNESSAHREVTKLHASLNSLVQEHETGGVEIETHVRDGFAHVEIVSAVAEFGCDLIVMGAEGMSNHARTLVGSVTHKVCREMPCSMLIVNDDDVLTARLDATLERIRNHMSEAQLLFAEGDVLESLGEYEQCILEQPSYAQAWAGMAESYESLGDLNKADRCREAVQLIRDKLG
jgi:nucleotide-binding universal stress UspA family protein